MNIDDLKLPGVDTNTNQNPVPVAPSVPATPVVPVTQAAPATQGLPEMSDVIQAEQQAMAQPQPVVQQTPVVEQAPVVEPAAVSQPQMTPFESTPTQNVQPAPTPMAESFTPVDQVVPKESETITPPIPVPTQTVAPAPVVNNAELPPSPAPVAVDNSGVPPAPAPVVVPMNTQEVTVVNTTKRRGPSSFILVILTLLLVLFVMKIDVVMNFIQKNIIQTNPTSSGNANNNNLAGRFIKINDPNSEDTINDIRFYNFIKSGDTKLLINYSSEKNHLNVEEMKMFIEIYSSSKELLTKKQFVVDSIANSEAGVPYMIEVTEQIYNIAYYAKVVTYSDEDLKRTSTLTCTYNDSNDSYLLQYKTVYNFTNNELNEYEVDKKIVPNRENKATTTAIGIIEKEKNDVTRFEIPATFENNELKYKVDLNSVNEGFIPVYAKGTAPAIVKINDTKKNWICE